MLPSFDYVRPGSIRDAIRHLSSDGARIHAGGTDLLSCLRDRVFDAQKVVSISKLNRLKGIGQLGDGSMRIGALTTVAEVAGNRFIKKRYTCLAQAASQVASPQLRNQGTIGGNICQKPWCWYYRGDFQCLRKGGDMCYAENGENQYHCIFGSDGLCYIVHPSDTAPALVALEAKVRIAGPGRTRTVSIDEFYVRPAEDVQRETILEPDEMVTEILVPPAPEGLRSSYRKVRVRRSFDFALAGVALALQVSDGKVTDGRVVLSGAAPIPWRSRNVEGVIIGKTLDSRTIANAADAVVSGAEPLQNNGYKIPLFRGIIEEQLRAIAKG
jgi:xanthine dehydrogenase YagS FAD-binding subunit